MFEKASRLKVRFETKKGLLTVEDLWDLPLISRTEVSLDDIAKSLNKKVKDNQEESFVVKKRDSNSILNLKFEIVKYIIDARLKEKEEKELEAARKYKMSQIQFLIEEKEIEGLKNAPIEDLKKMIEELK